MERDLLQLGFVLVTLGLVSGLFVQKFPNARMALANHMVGLVNGLLLVAFGLVWPRLEVGRAWLDMAFWLAVYASFANYLATLLAAIWNSGGGLMPIAAPGREGSRAQELVIGGLLVSLSLAIIAACLIVVVGLS